VTATKRALRDPSAEPDLLCIERGAQVNPCRESNRLIGEYMLATRVDKRVEYQIGVSY
jgi:hypothetical protein